MKRRRRRVAPDRDPDGDLILLGTATLGLWIARRRGERAEAEFARPSLPRLLRDALKARGWTQAYHNGSLTQEQRRELLEAIREASREWLRSEAEKVLPAPEFSAIGERVSGFFDKAKSYLREAFLAATLALTGPSEPDALSAAYLESQARTQLAYLDRFEAETTGGTQPLDGTFASRAELYGGALWQIAENVKRVRTLQDQGFTEERAVLGPSDRHCSTCLARVAKGWQPVGTLAPLGDSECMSNCRCHFEYKSADESARPGRAMAAPDLDLTPHVVPSKTRKTLPGKSVAGKTSKGDSRFPSGIASRLASYTEGDRKFDALRSAGAPSVAAKAEMDRAGKLVDEAIGRHATSGTKDSARALEEARAIFRAAFERSESFDRKRLAIAMQAIGGQSGTKLVDAGSTLDAIPAEARRAASTATGFIENILKGAGNIPVSWKPLTKRDAGRAYYDIDGNTVNVDAGLHPRTAIHELGHLLEEVVPGWKEAAHAFLRYRVKDEPPTHLRNIDPQAYSADEHGRKDKFGAAFGRQEYYVGKDYGAHATEITAMGLEKLFTDPFGFAHKDPEYVKFLLGLLDGNLRTP